MKLSIERHLGNFPKLFFKGQMALLSPLPNRNKKGREMREQRNRDRYSGGIKGKRKFSTT